MSESKKAVLTLYDLVNPSDSYTFYAPSIEVAGVCAMLLSTAYGATPVDGQSESSPVFFGWSEWLEQKGINQDWIDLHSEEIAAAYDSFLIGDARSRADVESMLEMLPEDKRQEWRDKRQDRRRSSLNKIGENAYEFAKKIREKAAIGSDRSHE